MEKEILTTNESGNNSNFLLPAILLDEILTAIAEYEETIDYEWGRCRSSEQLIKDGCMPELYNKLIAIKNGIKLSQHDVSGEICENPHCKDGVTMELYGEKYYCHICRDKETDL